MADENRMITFEYASSTWDQYKKQTVPSTKECMTKQEIINYFNVDENKLNSLTSNQLVRRDKFVGIVLIRGIFGSYLKHILEFDDEHLIVCGKFENINGKQIANISKISSSFNFSIDTSFNTNLPANNGVSKVLKLDNNTLLISLRESTSGICQLDLNGNIIRNYNINSDIKDVVSGGNFFYIKNRKFNFLNGVEDTTFNTNYNNIATSNKVEIINTMDISSNNAVIYYGGSSSNGGSSLLFLEANGNYVNHNIPSQFFNNTNSTVWSIKNISPASFRDIAITWSDNTGCYLSIINLDGFESKKFKLSSNTELRVNLNWTYYNRNLSLCYYFDEDTTNTDFSILNRPIKNLNVSRDHSTGELVNDVIIDSTFNQNIDGNKYSYPDKYFGVRCVSGSLYVGLIQGNSETNYNLYFYNASN